MRFTEVVFEVHRLPEGRYEAAVLGTSIYIQADSTEELRANAKNALRAYFDEDAMPRVIRLHFVEEQVLTL